jgi:hypothetical protein
LFPFSDIDFSTQPHFTVPTYTSASGIHVKLKSSRVSVGDVDPDVLDEILRAAYTAYAEADNLAHFVVTSGSEGHPGDGVHHRGSRHYPSNHGGVGYAVDLRVWGFDDSERLEVARQIQHQLGPQYDVVDEGTHLHVELDEL